MSPIEKAKQLIEKFKEHADWNNEYGSPEKVANIRHAKECAHIAVDEILNDYAIFNEKNKSYKVPAFWQQVRQCIENQ